MSVQRVIASDPLGNLVSFTLCPPALLRTFVDQGSDASRVPKDHFWFQGNIRGIPEIVVREILRFKGPRKVGVPRQFGKA